jgi:SAM-dependent methyltransferase
MTPGFADLDLALAMRRLYETGAYFAAIPARADAVADADAYWTRAVDPDGKMRDRFAERSSYLANVADELAYIATLTPGRVLDVGCGPGWLLSALDPRWERHGIELSAAAGTIAAEHAVMHIGPLETAAFEHGSFDLVVMYHVIEHIEDPVAAIRHVRRLLAPGGRLVLGTPDFDSGAARRYGTRYRLLADPTHISLFSNDSMHRFLRDHGFAIHRVDYPYFETAYFNEENLKRLLDADSVSPPFYGNFMTFYCTRNER